MLAIATALLRADFLPHGWCYRWDPSIVFLHVGSDLLIALEKTKYKKTRSLQKKTHKKTGKVYKR